MKSAGSMIFYRNALFAAALLLAAGAANAGEIPVTATMQHCVRSDDCVLLNRACGTGCDLTPVNIAFVGPLETHMLQSCGAVNETVCYSYPPIKTACVSGRCTIDYTYTGNAAPADYTGGGKNRTVSKPRTSVKHGGTDSPATADGLPGGAPTGTLGTITMPAPIR